MKHPEYEEFGFEWVDEMYPQVEDLFENVRAEEEWGGPDIETGFDPYAGCYTWDC